MNKQVNPSVEPEGKENKSDIAKREEAILEFWQTNHIFQKTLEQVAPQGDFAFYDGPPFATGTPHYGHLLAGTIKDVIPRYRTMRGFRVRRRWGWDCHGLPLENIIEKELNLETKKDIETYGLENFNEHARVAVLRYVDEWKKIVPRLGRFVDLEDAYRTMDPAYSETIWWIFKKLYDRDLIYEGFKSMHLCPRCETTLSNFEVNQGYQDITDLSVTVKFELVDEPGTFLLAWTTTPWTLPGNVALAVNPDLDYVKVRIAEENFILAKARLTILDGRDFELVETFSGAKLAGQKYHPVFDYYLEAELKDFRGRILDRTVTPVWQVLPADFVTLAEGTGVVHVAPAFGEDDYRLALEAGLPFVQHVSIDGRFKPEIIDFAGQAVKPKGNHQQADIEIVKHLVAKQRLFDKKKIVHSYPHCWRCQTPLLNYAASSWFVKVTALRDRLIVLNQAVGWVPEHVRDGRFGKWLEGARDWAISRSRFWGAPLPVWRCEACRQIKVFGSYDDLAKSLNDSGNQYWVMRHGEAEANLEDRISADPLEPNHLTKQGREKVRAAAKQLKAEGLDLIISSDFVRTRETAAIVADELGLSSEQIIFDPDLREIDPGEFNGKTWDDFNQAFGPRARRLVEHLPSGGENYNDVRRRVVSAVYRYDRDYRGKKILIISHGLPLFMLQATVKRWLDQDLIKAPRSGGEFSPAEIRPLPFVYLPHNRHYELDVHRPYIDEAEFPCACGGRFRRVSEVFDCWFESGAMPYAQNHYPFATDQTFDPKQEKGFPADFIAEGLDQTRGWFYSLLVLGTALFDRSPYRNVVTNGLVLAEDGQKMSKSLKNYPDPMILVERYGADALRLYLMSSPAVRGENLNFSETGVVEWQRRLVGRLMNTLAFYRTYEDPRTVLERLLKGLTLESPKHLLDRWILARLTQAEAGVSRALNDYEIDRAVRELDDFVDDWSTWYVRRSRDRFKEEGADKQAALTVSRFVLSTVAKLLAPLAPFSAEMIYRQTRGDSDPESVHLSSWPVFPVTADLSLLATMREVRQLVSFGLEARQTLGVKVRQPLAEVKIKNEKIFAAVEYHQLILEELNVKKLNLEASLAEEVWLDPVITADLRDEGLSRELIRLIQEERKRQNLNQVEPVDLSVASDSSNLEILRRFETEIKLGTNSRSLNLLPELAAGVELKANNLTFRVKIAKS